MPSSSKRSEANRRRWADPEYRARVSKSFSRAKKKWCAEHKNDPEYLARQRKASAAFHKKYDKNKAYQKQVGEKIREKLNTPEEKEKRKKLALANPYFNGERNGEFTTKEHWTEEHLANVRKHIIKYNKSKAGRKMASKRSKKTLSDPATKQRLMDGKDKWYGEHPEVRQAHAEKYLAPHNQARHDKAEKKKAIERARDMYKTSNVKPIIKPLPNQPDEYYDALEDFFAEGF